MSALTRWIRDVIKVVGRADDDPLAALDEFFSLEEAVAL